MKTEIEWAELHAPLFLAGTNLGQKLDPNKRTVLKMVYDEVKRHLYVSYNNKTARIPETSVLSMVEVQAPKLTMVEFAEKKIEESARAQGFAEAQVSTPQSHVFAGPGGGQTGQEDPVKRGPGRPPKHRVEL